MVPPNRLFRRIGLVFASAALFFIWSNISNSQNENKGVDVTTQHNDNDRTGLNPNETVLTPDQVNKDGFGKLFDLEVDGLVYAQPLIVSGIQIAGKVRNILLTVTEHNSLYCFDAETGEKLWSRNFGTPVPTPNKPWNQTYGFYRDLTPESGITSTPVIDRAANTIYLDHMTWNANANPPYGLHWVRAIDLVTSQDKFGSPAQVRGAVQLRNQSSIPVTPRHNIAATLHFVATNHLQRTALLLSQGRVVLGFAGHFDKTPFQGWIFSYDAKQLQQKPVIWGSTAGGPVTTAANNEGGIWQAGMGLTTDQQGNIYLMTGNGEFSESLAQFGDSAVKLSSVGGSLQAVDYFTPCNQNQLEGSDADLGSSGVLHLPGSNLIVGGGKQARIYLMNSNDLGKFAGNGASFDCPNPNVLQEFQVGCDVPPDATHARDTPCSPPPGHQSETHHIHGSPVYWRSDRRGPVIYVWTENDILRAFPFDQQQSRFVTADKKPITVKGCLETRENPMEPWTLGQAKSPGYFAPDKPNQFAELHQGMTGGMLSISSNRGQSGIVWATTPTNNDANQKVVPGILRAYDADDLKKELWNSYQVRDRDDFGNFAKHAPPTVANGKVYMPTFSKHISVYGLKPPASASAVNLLKNGGFEEGKQGWTGDFQVNDGYPYYDTNQGTLCPTKQKEITLAQVVIAPETGTYRLTAYCGTNIQDGNVVMPSQYKKVTLGVSVNGSPIPTPPAKVATYTGYQKYTFVFKASSQSSIKVWFYAPKVQPIPQTDCGVEEDLQPGSYAIIDVVSLVKITPR